jgi:hypothetical protein
MKKMKKLLFLAISITLFLTSCSQSSSDNSVITPTPTTGFSIDGTTYSNFNGKVVDNYHFSSTTESSFKFIFSDGSINVSAAPASYCGFTTSNASMAVNLDVFSSDTTILPGTYNFYNGSSSSAPSSYFRSFSIYLDKNGNHSFNDAQDKVYSATGGTVTISGTSPNYTIGINVTLNNGNNFQYTYNSGFTYVNNRAN